MSVLRLPDVENYKSFLEKKTILCTIGNLHNGIIWQQITEVSPLFSFLYQLGQLLFILTRTSKFKKYWKTTTTYKSAIIRVLCQFENSVPCLGNILYRLYNKIFKTTTCMYSKLNTNMSRLSIYIGAVLLTIAELYVVWFFFCVSWAPCCMSSQTVWSQPQIPLWARMIVSCQWNVAMWNMRAHWLIHLRLVPHILIQHKAIDQVLPYLCWFTTNRKVWNTVWVRLLLYAFFKIYPYMFQLCQGQ